MTTKKSTKKSTKKAAKKTTKKAAKKATKKAAKKATKKAGKKAAKKATKKATKKSSKKTRSGGGKGNLSVRMYRVGFGDFFLITVPTKGGPQHILIDCGVHAGNIGTMDACVKDMAQYTKGRLALVIATHYHADHLSGFASNFEDFAQFEVDMVWITNRLDPENEGAKKFKAQLRSLAGDLQFRLGLRAAGQDENTDEGLATQRALFKVSDALGLDVNDVQLGAAKREGSNDKAIRLLTSGFKNKPPVRYYQGGEVPELPSSLLGAITAELLGPAPIDAGGEFSTADNATEQYLAAAAEDGLPPDTLRPFDKDWPSSARDYAPSVFSEYRGGQPNGTGTAANMELLLKQAQPDSLLAAADKLDGTLNNQSLVILFTVNKRKLLFVGDAQWSNWSYWLYGKNVSGKDPGILKSARDILESVDFYKVGHHGSTNANPIPAVTALNPECVSMCSTESSDAYPHKKRPYGTISKDPHKKGTEVPRITLMEEMEKLTDNRLVRSDWIPVSDPFDILASPEAKGQLPRLPPNFEEGNLYIDYIFPN
jgi:beta-lactamase superfamily II metal-dependent hydrolase